VDATSTIVIFQVYRPSCFPSFFFSFESIKLCWGIPPSWPNILAGDSEKMWDKEIHHTPAVLHWLSASDNLQIDARIIHLTDSAAMLTAQSPQYHWSANKNCKEQWVCTLVLNNFWEGRGNVNDKGAHDSNFFHQVFDWRIPPTRLNVTLAEAPHVIYEHNATTLQKKHWTTIWMRLQLVILRMHLTLLAIHLNFDKDISWNMGLCFTFRRKFWIVWVSIIGPPSILIEVVCDVKTVDEEQNKIRNHQRIDEPKAFIKPQDLLTWCSWNRRTRNQWGATARASKQSVIGHWWY
jgi:hypothetical protein